MHCGCVDPILVGQSMLDPRCTLPCTVNERLAGELGPHTYSYHFPRGQVMRQQMLPARLATSWRFVSGCRLCTRVICLPYNLHFRGGPSYVQTWIDMG